MIEIKKHGSCVKKKYLTGCDVCGCEFYFTYGDYKGKNGEGVIIQCPECGNMWLGQYMEDISWGAIKLDEK